MHFEVSNENLSKQDLLLGLVFTTHSSELHCLWEGTNSGGWEDWKVKLLLLSIKSGGNICSTAMIRTLQCSSLVEQQKKEGKCTTF